MKIDELLILEELNFSLIEEGVRFGFREANEVLRDPNIRIGIEYEFKVNDDIVGDSNYQSNYSDERDYYVNENVSSTMANADGLLTAIKNLQEYGEEYEDTISLIYELVDVYNKTKDNVDMNELRVLYAKYKNDIESIMDFLNEIEDHLDEMWRESGPVDIDEYIAGLNISDVLDLRDSISNVEDGTEFIIDMFSTEEDVLNFRNLFLASLEELSVDFGSLADLIFSDINLEQTLEDNLTIYYTQLFDAEVDSGLIDLEIGGNTNSEEIASIIESMLVDGEGDIIYTKEIERVMPDASVIDGTEVISKPLKIADALNLLEKMHNFIQENGYTDNTTGMHVNISAKDMRFTRGSLNVLKLVLFGDKKFIGTKYPPREYVSEILPISTSAMEMKFEHFLSTTSSSSISREFIKMEHWLRSQIQTQTKYQSINFTHLFTESDDRKRIEFRYFGGDDYEYNTEDMKFEILRAVYHMKLAYDEEEKRKEYIQKILKFFDSMSLELAGITFDQLLIKYHEGYTTLRDIRAHVNKSMAL